MNLGEMISVARVEYLNDTVSNPYFFRDETVTRAFNWAQMEACRRARLLVSATAFTADVDGPDPAVLDPRIIFVKRAIVAGATRPLRKVSYRDLDDRVPGWEDAVGEPACWMTDYAPGSIRLYPAPEQPVALRLVAVHEPLTEMASESDEPAIPARYHQALIAGAAAHLLMHPDAETLNPVKAAEFMAIFEQEFGTKSSAIDETWINENYDYGAPDGVF